MKTIVQMYPSMPAASPEERARLRPLGRHRELYHQTLHGLVDIARAADELGYWGMSFVEHHLHSEGFEVGPCPGIMNAWLSTQTRRLRMGQLGYVLTARDPIRVAEETAVLDHIFRGRFFVGFARGYQSRWIRTLGQAYQSDATLLERDTDARKRADEANRRLFREMVEVVQKAWTEDSFRHDGEFYKVPFPVDGIEDYPGVPTARAFGAPGEVSPDGRIVKVSVVPAPYQTPHPPVFINSSGSPESARWAGEKGFIGSYLAPLDILRRQEQAYREGAAAAGRQIAVGANQGVWRFIVIGETREEALRKVEQSVLPMMFDFYVHFYPMDLFGRGGNTALEVALQTGIVLAGTAADVRDQLDALRQEIPFEYLILISHYALEPKEDFLQDLELFATKVMPEMTR